MLTTLYPLKMTPLLGYWDADHDRLRTRYNRNNNAQCTNYICISKSPIFSLRTSIVLLVSVSLAPHRKYTMRQIGKKTPVAPICEWINGTAKRLNLTYICNSNLIFFHSKNFNLFLINLRNEPMFHESSADHAKYLCSESMQCRYN